MANDHESNTVAPAVVADTLLAELAPDLAKVGKAVTGRNLPGLGSIYLRKHVWWVSYSFRGKRVRESSYSARESDAVKLLRKRIEEVGKGRRRDPVSENKVRMAALLDGLEADYRNNRRRSAETLAFRLAALREAFGADRALDVTAARIARYRDDRLAQGKAPATVNRELAALRRAFALAVEREALSVAPVVKLLDESDNVRQGFVTPAQFESVVSALPDHLRDVARFGYLTGWRRGEITTLEWRDVDLDAGTITLRREESKNKQPRVVPFLVVPDDGGLTIFGALGELVAKRVKARTVAGDGARFVFHRNGRRLRDFRGAWEAACVAAGRPGLLFHDLRRSAERNLVGAGIDQRVAMAVTGHQTIAVFQRYRIVSDDDVKAALQRVQAPRNGPENGTPIGRERDPGT
ncbi:MAG: site-specific integrase [Candidatus Rokubacteria bacterium]|nr:site-specific integrase [Candidatus Rokubacteria bacterium]